jgi:hypothetical protein
MDQDRRDELLEPAFQRYKDHMRQYGWFREGDSYGGGIQSYTELDLQTLTQLVDEGFVDLEDRQNDSPSAGEYFEFLQTHPNFTVHGYAVNGNRPDYRITIEGLECKEGEYTQEDLIDFVRFERLADEFRSVGNLRSWWD